MHSIPLSSRVFPAPDGRIVSGSGFTFYDDLVTEQLSPRAADQRPMTLFAFGRPASGD